MSQTNKVALPYLDGNQIELITSGEPFFNALEDLINQATKFIHLQIYIFDEDETGKKIFNLLKSAVERGVSVYLLVDAFGSHSLSKRFIRRIKRAHIHFRMFAPLFTAKGFQFSLRLHHKIILADGNKALVGGINIANKYRGVGGKKPWLDFAVIVKGPVCKELLDICKRVWNRMFSKDKSYEIAQKIEHFEHGIKAKAVQNNWYRRKIEVSHSYREAIRQSKNSIILVASYFLPGRIERRLLRRASNRGVKIKLILGSDSDVHMVKRATDYLYGFLLRNNIEIFEYRTSVVHGKIGTVDDKWVTIGSYNLNHLSDYGSIEANVNVYDCNFSSQVKEMLNNIMSNECANITLEDYQHHKTPLIRLKDWFSYQVIRISMRLMFQLTRNQ